MANPNAPSQPGSSNVVQAYFKGVQYEWTQITWPTVPQLWAQTLVVLFVVTLTTVLVWGIDLSWHTLITLITPKPGL